jgi:hypothetical protein
MSHDKNDDIENIQKEFNEIKEKEKKLKNENVKKKI